MPTILIVDDQSVNRSIYAKMAASVGDDVCVETFGDPRDALAAALVKTPDLIVTDYKMPSMNGAEFVRRIRDASSLADIPVMVITVYDEKDFRFRALDAGATDFLLSPVEHREFIMRARNLLKLRKQQLLIAEHAEFLAVKLERSERSLEEAVRDSSERLAQVIDSVPALISATGQDGEHLFVNAGYVNATGSDPAKKSGSDSPGTLDEESVERNRALDRLVVESGRPIHGFEEEIADRDGVRRVFLTSKSPLRNAANKTIGVVTSSLDITDRKEAERHLQHLAHHDSLTGMPNRVLLSETLQREIARARRGDRRFALHLIDLDEFKKINDAFGHPVGDKFLVAIAERLRTVEKDGHFVARLGGDEFAVLQTLLPNCEGTVALAEKIQRLVREPMTIGGARVSTAASIGIAVHSIDGADAEDLLRHADIAMYEAKSKGGGQYGFFAADMNLRATRAITLDAELRDAIERNEFELHYQPQIRLSDGQTVGVEALIRWRRPDGTLAYPISFLPRAEENGMILEINEWVLSEACRQAVEWRKTGLPRMRMSVNLSPIQFRRGNLPLFVAKVLNDSGLDSRMLELELTENFLIHDVDEVVAQLHQLRALGVAISIDDFGSGFSSLSYMKRLPVDRVKIDQSFVRDLASDPSDRAIVAAIVNLAHSVHMEVIAEGVEDQDQLHLVRTVGCDAVQGNFFSRPMPAGAFAEFLSPALRQVAAG